MPETTNEIPTPKFEIYEVTTEDEFAEVFPLLQQLGRIETPETIEDLTLAKSWAQYQKSYEQNYRLYVAKNTSEVLGLAGLRVCDDPLNNSKPYGIINNLVVEEDYRGLGIGTDILERVELVAQKYKCDLCMIVYLTSNKQAKDLYEQNGYNHVANMMVKEI
jgi:GNAT superfamily N-acetyltransferase